MTGFGAAEGPVLGGRLRMDVRTVNHRHLQMQLKVPDELLPLEGELREALRSAFDRGHVTVTARWIETPEAFGSIGVNIERAREVVSALRELQTALGLSGEVDVALVARQPDVLAAREGDTSCKINQNTRKT